MSVVKGMTWTQNRSTRKKAYCVKFGIPYPSRRAQRITKQILDLLDGCKDDDARRLLLGVKGES